MAARSPVRILTRIHNNPVASSSRTVLPLLRQPQPPPQQPQQQRRSFLSTALSAALSAHATTPQVLTSSARLPYHHAQVYDRIADIDSYATFLPYCKSARVTEWTTDASGGGGDGSRRWPARADLTAGWGGIEETYSSRVFCAPDIGVVEAVSGFEGWSELSADELARHGLRDRGPSSQRPSSSSSSSSMGAKNRDKGEGEKEEEEESELFKSLVTRWTVTPVEEEEAVRGADRSQHRDWTDVRLDIKFLFANPLYGAVSSAVVDKLAPVMVRAFVEQAGRVLKNPPTKP
ncbi:hypothetical protein MGN70_002604 [Eutypa lata]|nr:hypothetical protein MGN70_002604 [Eutypa lata]